MKYVVVAYVFEVYTIIGPRRIPDRSLLFKILARRTQSQAYN